jgi:hypothetical protein
VKELLFSATTEFDNDTCYLTVQETSDESKGVNVRLAFDPHKVTPGYLIAVVDALPTVFNQYVQDVVNDLEGRI